jgi:hypothetical protein
MPARVAGIHVFLATLATPLPPSVNARPEGKKGVDGRTKSGHDDVGVTQRPGPDDDVG